MKEVVHIDHTVRTLADIGAVGVVGATLVGLLPSAAAILTIAWTGIRIYETETVQKLIKKGRKKDDDEGPPKETP